MNNSEHSKQPGSIFKTAYINILIIGIFIVGCFIFFISILSTQYLELTEKQYLGHLKEMVEVARNSIEPIVEEYRNNKITRDNALLKIRNLVRLMTYHDNEGNNYIFMSSYDGTMLVQPFQTTKELTNQWDLQDSNGTYIIRELCKKAKQGKGYVTYYYTPPNSLESQEKTSYVIGIPELKVYLGTGRYMLELRQAQNLFRLKILGLTSALLILLFFLIKMFLQQIKNSHDRFEKVLDSLDSIVAVTNLENNNVLFLNKLGRETFGNIINQKCWKTLQQGQSHPCDFCINDTLLDAKGNPNGIHIYEFNNTLNGEWYECRDQALHWTDGKLVKMEIATNITQRKKAEDEKSQLEAQFKQAQKMESIGMLAGGVAHEINNPISIIMNFAELILEEAESNSQIAEDASEIVNESKRVANIVRNLLAFSRQDEDIHQYNKVKELIDSTLVLTNKILSKDQIKCTTQIQDNLPEVRCANQQIKQVIMNLITNARDALNERYPDYNDNKIMLISAINIELEDSPWVRITVEDHGAGINPDIQERIFDPFFTSKPRDKGTGLGLSVSYGIVKEHNGHLTLESVHNEYTRFHLDLPVNQEENQIEESGNTI